MKKNIITTLLLIMSMPLAVFSQQALTLETARQMALTHSHDLQIANLQHGQARQQQAAARTLRLPAFSATGTAIYQNKDFELEMILPTQVPNPLTGQLEPNIMMNPLTGQPVIGPDGNPVFNMYAWLPLEISLSGAYMAGITMEQPLFTGFKIHAGNKMADIGLAMAAENINLQQLNTIVATDHAYFTYISLHQKVRLAQQAMAMLQEIVQLAKNSAEVGLTTRNDQLKAEVEYNNARLNLQKALNGLELSRMNLCRIIGLPFNTPIIATDTVFDLAQPVQPSLMEINTRQRPEYRLLEKNIQLSEQNIRMARADFLPTAGVQAGYNHIGGIKFSGTEFSNASLNVMASVTIPLFKWGQGVRRISAARIELEKKQAELEKNLQLMQLEAEQARMNKLLALQRIQIGTEALQQADENLRVSRNNYELGMETITGVLMAQTLWQQASSELIDARADFRIKETEWLKATGKLGM